MSRADEADLSREELLDVLDAVRAIARASVETDIATMLESVLRIAATATNSERAELYTMDESGENMCFAGGYPCNDEISRHYRRIHLADLLPSSLEAGSLLSRADEFGPGGARARAGGISHGARIPIRLHGKVVGSLGLARTKDIPYGTREQHLGEVLGELLVVHIENARLYSDARRGMAETRMLLDASRASAGSLEVGTRLDPFAEVLARMLGAATVYMMLLDEERTSLVGVASSNPLLREEMRSLRLPLTFRSPLVDAVKSARTIVFDASTPAEERSAYVESYAHRAILAIPLLVQGAAIGVVVIDDERPSRTWTRSEITRAELIAQSVAVGVANTRLFNEVRTQKFELERAQQELINRERLAALGELAAIMAHEVRNPLAIIFNSLSALEKRLPREGDTATLLTIIGEEGRRLERLVRELLDFARPLSPSFDLESIETTLEMAALAASRELPSSARAVRVFVGADVPPVCVDASMIRHALVNVVLNGLQAAGEGGKVTMSATVEHAPAGQFVRIDVTDSGPGIPAKVVARVFEPFFTTKAMGTGLGLPVVRSIVESHGGDVRLSSTEGRGTTVSIRLPTERRENLETVLLRPMD